MSNAWIVPPLPIVAASAFGTISGDPLHVGNDYAGVCWTGAINVAGGGRAELLLDLGSDQPVDTVMIFGATDLGPGLEVRTATTAQYAAGSQAYQSWGYAPLYAGTERLVTGNGVGLATAPGPAVTARYIQLLIYPNGGPFPIARVVVGRRIQLERNFSFGAAFGVRDLGSLDFSARGVLLRRRGRKLRTLGITFANVRKDEVEAQTAPLLERIGNTEMVALLTDPAPHPMRERRCYFGPLVGDLGQIWKSAAGWETKVNMVSIF